jgi:TRAP-type uncharacterized transport system fused permease subunit
MNFYFLTIVALIVLLTVKDTLKISKSVVISLVSVILIMMVVYRIKFESFLSISDETTLKMAKQTKENEDNTKKQTEFNEKIDNTHKRL